LGIEKLPSLVICHLSSAEPKDWSSVIGHLSSAKPKDWSLVIPFISGSNVGIFRSSSTTGLAASTGASNPSSSCVGHWSLSITFASGSTTRSLLLKASSDQPKKSLTGAGVGAELSVGGTVVGIGSVIRTFKR